MMGNLAGMGLLRESRGGKKGKHWSPGFVTRGCALGVSSGPGWGRTGPGIIPHLLGMKAASKYGYFGS